MSLKHLLIAGSAAALSYWVVSNKDKIIQEVQKTEQLWTGIQDSYQNIQKQAAIIQSYREPLQEMAADLQYKFRVYQQEASAHLNEIKTIQEKYGQAGDAD